MSPGEPSLAAVVCIPARDEAERVPALLRSLNAQHGFGADVRLRVTLVANNCGDGTAAAARTTAALCPSLDLDLIEAEFPPDEAHVGTARRRALDAGAEWLAAKEAADGALLTTDADARVPPDWVRANLAALAGAEIVGGRLVIDRDGAVEPALADLHARIERYWAHVRALEEHLDPLSHDPAPRHGDHTGASLCLRADLYRAVGGLPVLPRGEDNALVARVLEAGGRLRHSPAVTVHVSDRLAGRAEGGMAVEMKRRVACARGGAPYALPTPIHWHTVIVRRVELRRAWREPALRASILAWLGLASQEALLAESPNEIAFVERADCGLRLCDDPAPLVAIDAALEGFEELLDRFTELSRSAIVA